MHVWIPVSESLPEVGQRVLFSWRNTLGKRRTSTGWYEDGTREGFSEDFFDEDCDGVIPAGWYEAPWEGETIFQISDVTHWMRLPPPPEAVALGAPERLSGCNEE